MFLFKFIANLIDSAEQRASGRLAEHATRHLDDHLLADIGLYREHGRLYPIAGLPETKADKSLPQQPQPAQVDVYEAPYFHGDSPGLER